MLARARDIISLPYSIAKSNKSLLLAATPRSLTYFYTHISYQDSNALPTGGNPLLYGDQVIPPPEEILSFDPSQSCSIAFYINRQSHPRFKHNTLILLHARFSGAV